MALKSFYFIGGKAMFSFLKRKKNPEEIYSPVNGKCIPLENVPDKIFAQKLMGDGAGFEFEGDTVYAPCDGEILMVAHTKHAVGMKTRSGVEILVHIGLNTVELNGKGFDVLVKAGQKVKVHDPIIRVDRKFMQEKNIDLTTPMIITNMDEIEFELNEANDVTRNSVIMTVKMKQ